MTVEPLPALCGEISVTQGGRIYVCCLEDHEPGKHYFVLETPCC